MQTSNESTTETDKNNESKYTKINERPPPLPRTKKRKSNSNKMCSVFKCHNRNSNEISLHKFPRQEALFKEWWLRTKMAKKPNRNNYVCSKHFDESLIKITKKGKRHLKTGALPTIDLPRFSDLPSSATKIAMERALRPQLKTNTNLEILQRPTNSKNQKSCVKNKKVKGKYILHVKKGNESIKTIPEWENTVEISDSTKAQIKVLQESGQPQILLEPRNGKNQESSQTNSITITDKLHQLKKGDVYPKTQQVSNTKSISDKVTVTSKEADSKQELLSSVQDKNSTIEITSVKKTQAPEKIIHFKDLILRKVTLPKKSRLLTKGVQPKKILKLPDIKSIIDKVDIVQKSGQGQGQEETLITDSPNDNQHEIFPSSICNENTSVQNKILEIVPKPSFSCSQYQESFQRFSKKRLIDPKEPELGQEEMIIDSSSDTEQESFTPRICIDNNPAQNKNIVDKPSFGQLKIIAKGISIMNEKDEGNKITKHLNLKSPNILDLIQSDNHLKTMTSLCGFEVLDGIIKRIENIKDYAKHSAKDIDRFNLKFCVLLVLIKLKTNYDFCELALLFQISPQMATEIFRETLPVIRTALKTSVHWPTRQEIHQNNPLSFYTEFKNLRGILDCTIILVKKNTCLSCKIPSYANYNGDNTFKFVICFSPSGLITFISRCYSSAATDKLIFEKEKLIEYFEQGDAIMIRNFNGTAIKEELKQRGIHLFQACSEQSKKLFTKRDYILNKKIRVYIKQVMKQLKNFKILKQKVDNILFDQVDDIIFVCSSLVNLSSIKLVQ